MYKMILSRGYTGAAVFASLLLSFTFVASPANAQATRTWVSGVGDDANPCSRTAPCKTFAGAISKTAAGGEISVLDPGGFGAVTITKSISITNDNAGEAGILASGTNGVIINAGSSDSINLRGIVIDGGTPVTPGLNGVRFLAGKSLTIQNSVIKNFLSAGSFGIIFTPATSARMTIRDTHMTNNGSGTGGAISIKPTAAAFASVALSRVTMDNNINGLIADASTTTGSLLVSVLDSSASNNNGNGFQLIGGASAQSSINLDHSASVNNTNGVHSTNTTSTINLSNAVISGNNAAIVSVTSGKIVSFSNNMLDGNFTVSSPTQTKPAQ